MTFAARVQALRDRYPYQFARTFQYGLSIETGWIAIIESACAQIDLALEEGGARKQNFSFLQVKEKLGSLRMAWDRAWRVPEAPRSLADDEPEFIFPESVPEDPEADQFETVEAYLASPRAAEWDRLHMIPNPALANVRLEPRRYFDRLMTINFEDGVPDAEQDYITRSIAMLVMVPEDVSERIRTIIEGAEQQASITCQFCGAPGNRQQLDGDGWIVVGCERHGTRKAVVEFNKQLESGGARHEK